MMHEMPKLSGDEIQAAFAEAQNAWRAALDAHRMAPPDAGFSARLAQLAEAARADAAVCRQADAAGFEWPPHRASSSKPPHELQPGSGRRGPRELWRRFDRAVTELTRAAAGSDLIEVAAAYEQFASAAGDLAAAIEREDRSSGLLARTPRRRSA
jgi:hypothetical protein